MKSILALVLLLPIALVSCDTLTVAGSGKYGTAITNPDGSISIVPNIPVIKLPVNPTK